MRIAVPEWEGRISPVFDTARRLRCFDVAGDALHPAGESEMTSEQPQSRVAVLRELGVRVLLCGAISHPMAALVSAAGIRLLPFLAGEVDQVASAFAMGRLEQFSFHMPGCCGAARRRRRGRCGRHWEAQP